MSLMWKDPLRRIRTSTIGWLGSLRSRKVSTHVYLNSRTSQLEDLSHQRGGANYDDSDVGLIPPYFPYPSPSESIIDSVPAEIWLYIHRLVTADISPLAMSYSDQSHSIAIPDMHDFLRNARSFVLVCRLWNTVAKEILYENVRVDHQFHTLYTALERPGTALLVRSIRLSKTRLDHNYAILSLCPRVQIVVQPDALTAPREQMLEAFSNVDFYKLQLPTLHFLRDVYWEESLITYKLLSKVLRTSSNVERLFLSALSTLAMNKPDDAFAFPLIPGLTTLDFPRLGGAAVLCLLQIDLQRLTRLHCALSHLSLQAFPVFPSVHTLDLSGPRSEIPFPTIFARFPALRDISYGILNRVSQPVPGQSPPLSCIRLHTTATIRIFSVYEHFDLILSQT
ncbi:hypothetical protein DFH09DRAFT_1504248 [Mycena vulgaris]|nr:hypothetical protein DFH09DRAFT_1504248 [Mycena vulgaris]